MILNDKKFAFNIWDYDSAKAVIDAASTLQHDVILQTSVGVFKNLDLQTFRQFIMSYSTHRGVKAYLNIDHCKDEGLLYAAIDNGWDMVMVDGSHLPLKENIEFTNKITVYAHSKGVLVEAEVGQVKGIEDDIVVQQDAIASKADIKEFLSSTDVDFIAVAFGNAHGEYKIKPNLHYDLVEFTTSITDKPFVVHGGSGLSDETLQRLLSISGVKKINISTDLKLAYLSGIEKSKVLGLLDSDGFQPTKVADRIHNEIMNTAILKMKLLK